VAFATGPKSRRFLGPLLRALFIALGASLLLVSPQVASAAEHAQHGAVASHQSSQSLVLSRINALRRRYNLPLGTLTRAFDAQVSAAAVLQRDPALPPLVNGLIEEFGIWGIAPYAPPPGNAPASQILQAWVYADGWMGSDTTNKDCTGPGAPGCNGHRRALLSKPPAPGAKLLVDIGVRESDYEGGPGTSIAVLLIWQMPASH
jgi:hypothetical protein